MGVITDPRAGEIVGYAYAGPFSGRVAYARSAPVIAFPDLPWDALAALGIVDGKTV